MWPCTEYDVNYEEMQFCDWNVETFVIALCCIVIVYIDINWQSKLTHVYTETYTITLIHSLTCGIDFWFYFYKLMPNTNEMKFKVKR